MTITLLYDIDINMSSFSMKVDSLSVDNMSIDRLVSEVINYMYVCIIDVSRMM